LSASHPLRVLNSHPVHLYSDNGLLAVFFLVNAIDEFVIFSILLFNWSDSLMIIYTL
jgi:hypothetical protein